MVINFNTSFRDAYNRLTREQKEELRNELTLKLNVKGKKTFYRYLNGVNTNISKAKYLKIAKTFEKYGINRDDIFDK